MSTIAENLTSILTEKFSVPTENIRPEARLDELGLDSLDLIEVLFEVEEKFDIRIPQDGPAMRTGTMQELLDTITKLVEQKQDAPQAQTA
jgi:acyl carrier protein